MRYLAIAAVSLLLDALLGDPEKLLHPVVVMGRWISLFEKKVRPRLPASKAGELAGSLMLAVTTAGGTFVITQGALLLAGRIHPLLWWGRSIFWGWQCLAMKGLADEGKKISRALEYGTLDEARRAVSRIVGRDTSSLTKEGVIRAAVESTAENYSDGVAAPLFFLLLFGAAGAMTYKAVNTMDSMVGYKNEKYLYFGRIPARLDDLANLVPSRLAALTLIPAAFLHGENAPLAWKIWRRDRRKHPSPNSAQTEAAMAGALEIVLGGPTSYFGQVHDKPWIGDNISRPKSGDIGRAAALMQIASVLFLAVIGPVTVLLRMLI